MPLRLKLWTYRINQHDIVLECSFSFWGRAQARLLVDDKELASAEGSRFWPLRLETVLDDTQPPMPILAIITPRLFSVHSGLWVYGALIPPSKRSKLVATT